MNQRNKKMRPAPSSIAALHRMRAVKLRNTAPEKALQSALQNNELEFEVDQKPINNINRKADIIFRSLKIAIFVDGCFWHGCPIHGTQAKANSEFWKNKIAQNQIRDKNTNELLINAGWEVIRVWEHEDPEIIAERICDRITKKKS